MSSATPNGWLIVVLAPASVRIGAMLPLVAALKISTLSLMVDEDEMLVTRMRPLESTALPIGKSNLVLLPLIVNSGAAAPVAPAAYTLTLGGVPPLITYDLPVLST